MLLQVAVQDIGQLPNFEGCGPAEDGKAIEAAAPRISERLRPTYGRIRTQCQEIET